MSVMEEFAILLRKEVDSGGGVLRGFAAPLPMPNTPPPRDIGIDIEPLCIQN
jgi:hypothetical protein